MLRLLRDHGSKVLIVLCMLLVVGVPFLLQPRSEADAGGAGAGAGAGVQLVIYTPHNEQIRYEFARGFNLWRRSQGLSAVTFDWRSSGGTSDLRKTVLSQYEAAAARARRAGRPVEEVGIGADLFFGGGDYEHNQLAAGIDTDGDEKRVADLPVTVDSGVSAELLEEAFPDADLAGAELYHRDTKTGEVLWVGVVLSSFGIVYNRDVLALDVLRLPEPRTWEDLTHPRYAGWVALSDPNHSGSIAVTYNTILRRQGWGPGWHLLRRAFANSRYFTAGSTEVPVDVSNGNAAAGMCIDFYGRFQAGAVPDGRVGYTDPPGATAITADPISVLRGGPEPEVARQFVAWLLTPEAQALWQLRVAAPGGPDRFALRRQPIRQDFYRAADRSSWTDPEIDPFVQARPFPAGTPDYYRLVAPITYAMAIGVLDDLHAAWAAILETSTTHRNYGAMLELFDAMPDDLNPPAGGEAAMLDLLKARWKADPESMLRDRQGWMRFYQGNYRRIVELSRETAG